ncbi:MAG: hypothetical protein HY703_01715, partial [Gemmatimonadetes bacterium]|nr:hypothetical protein [Gemmatimonadota bacterium]
MLPSSLLRPFAALALLAGVVAPLGAQQPPSGFNLAATRDFAVTGMRTAPSFRFWVTNAGPMDAQQG